MVLHLSSYEQLSFDFEEERCAGVLVPHVHDQFESVKALRPGDVIVFQGSSPLPETIEVSSYHRGGPVPAGSAMVVRDVLNIQDVGVYLHAHNPI